MKVVDVMYKKGEQLYEGKAKKVFKTDNPDIYIVDYKDDATAFNAQKKGTIVGKGVINNKVTNHMMKIMEKNGIPTHFIEELSDRETAVKNVTIMPIEVIIRNIAAGSMCKRLGMEEGVKLDPIVLEYSYKDDALGDPLINDYHALAMGLATPEELDIIAQYAFKVNAILSEYVSEVGITLVDFKIEFGKDKDGNILLADEISPDTCRFWDKATGKKLDKDRFRQDLGDVEDAYKEIRMRLTGEESL